MKPVNLLVLAQGFLSAPQDLLGAFEAQLSEREEPLGVVKPHEADSVARLVRALWDSGVRRASCFEGFVFSFRIPQISSEFDLLKIADGYVINIELKSQDVGIRRIREQLMRNRYYLSPLERVVYTFTFVSSTGRLYELSERGWAREVGIDRLVNVLQNVGDAYEGQVEDLFRVRNYLVSPLNDSQKFLDGHYFLTNHQSQIKASFLRACAERERCAPEKRCVPEKRRAPAGGDDTPLYIVYGDAGTGKSLLLYDLARSWRGTGQVCVVHCGVLCDGHKVLNEGQERFRIVSAKGLERVDLEGFEALFVDEAQRMWPSQLKYVVDMATANHMPLYLSLDRRQVLSRREETFDVEKAVHDAHQSASIWELSHRIRTNRELADFIRALFGLRGAERFVRTSHVKVASATDARMARELIEAFRVEGYQFISLGMQDVAEADALVDKLSIPESPDPYAVIGQEFDRVVMAMGPRFSLSAQHCRQLLYQGLTRARSEVALVVYGNEPLLRKLLGKL